MDFGTIDPPPKKRENFLSCATLNWGHLSVDSGGQKPTLAEVIIAYLMSLSDLKRFCILLDRLFSV